MEKTLRSWTVMQSKKKKKQNAVAAGFISGSCDGHCVAAFEPAPKLPRGGAWEQWRPSAARAAEPENK